MDEKWEIADVVWLFDMIVMPVVVQVGGAYLYI